MSEVAYSGGRENQSLLWTCTHLGISPTSPTKDLPATNVSDRIFDVNVIYKNILSEWLKGNKS